MTETIDTANLRALASAADAQPYNVIVTGNYAFAMNKLKARPDQVVALLDRLAAAEARIATLADDAARDRADAVRWRVLRSERETSLIIMHFGNGCINRTIEEVETIIDARAAASTSTHEGDDLRAKGTHEQ